MEPHGHLAALLDRRGFLTGMGAGLAATALTGIGAAGCSDSRRRPPAQTTGAIQPIPATDRADMARDLRRQAADSARGQALPTLADNGDEALYPERIGSFSKGLPHNARGEVDPAAYQSLLDALSSGDHTDFEAISTAGPNRLCNPQAGLAFDMLGPDPQAVAAPPAPAFASAETAAEMVDLYWMAICRDVHFSDWGTHPDTNAAATELSSLQDWRGPKQGGQVTTGTLFRDGGSGPLNGPYLSQFLWQPVPYGALAFDQLMRTVPAGQEHLTTYSAFLAAQEGAAIPAQTFDPTRRYIRNLRDLGEWVHADPLYQAHLNACLIILGYGDDALDPDNPYRTSTRQSGFATLGPVMIQGLLGEVATRAIKATWFQKWFVHRRLRPEAYGGRVHIHTTGQASYPLHAQVLNSQARSRIETQYGTSLLPQVFPEGSPVHPTYTAGHATVAAACVTVLKAFFDESFVVPNPVVSNADGSQLVAYSGAALTVGGELDKLAANISLGRNGAGVHWYSDHTASLALGEAVALALLAEQKPCFNEPYSFTLRRFDGTTVTI